MRISLAVAALLSLAAPAFAQSTDADTAIRNGMAREGVQMDEGRAAAPDYDEDGDETPSEAWRPRGLTPGAGADLVGPGSGMDNPTGGHDVSR